MIWRLSDHPTEGEEAARPLRDLDRQQGLAPLAQLGPLRDMAQAIEVDVGAALDRDQMLAADAPGLDIPLEARHRERTGRLGDAAGVVEDVLDRRTDLVGADQDDLVHPLPGDAEGLLADQAHRHPVGEETDLRQLHPPTGRQRRMQGRRLFGLDTDDPHLRHQPFDIGGDPRDQPAASHRHEDGVGRLRMLAQDLHADGALAGDHVRIVERVQEGQAPLRPSSMAWA